MAEKENPAGLAEVSALPLLRETRRQVEGQGGESGPVLRQRVGLEAVVRQGGRKLQDSTERHTPRPGGEARDGRPEDGEGNEERTGRPLVFSGVAHYIDSVDEKDAADLMERLAKMLNPLVDEKLRRVRNEALDEAAKEADLYERYWTNGTPVPGPKYLGDRIRNLKR